MKTFKQFINERVNYHIARGGEDPMEHKDRPIWFAHDKKLMTGIHAWYHNDWHKSSHIEPDIYTAKVKGKIAHYGDPKVNKILQRMWPHGQHHNIKNNYHDLLNGGNARKFGGEILGHSITTTLQKHGYVGYRHPEMPTGQLRDEKGQYPHESTIVFNRKHIKLRKLK